MKIFGVVKQNGTVKLLIWNSKKAFQATESSLDEKFNQVIPSDELNTYSDKYEMGMIVHSEVK